MTRRSVLLAPMALVGAVVYPAARSGAVNRILHRHLRHEGSADRRSAATHRPYGYDGVELSLMPEWQCNPAKMSGGDRRRLRELLGETRLVVAALNEALLITAESRMRNLERLRLAADLAHHLAPGDPPVIETMLGGKTGGVGDVETRHRGRARFMGGACRTAQRDVVFQAARGPCDSQSCPRMGDASPRQQPERAEICYDYCHMFVASESLESSLRALAPQLTVVALKDARWTDAGHQFLLPGDGDTDYPLYFRLLKELGYRGWVAAEVAAIIWRRPGYDPAPPGGAYANMAPFWNVAGLERPSRKPHESPRRKTVLKRSRDPTIGSRPYSQGG